MSQPPTELTPQAVADRAQALISDGMPKMAAYSQVAADIERETGRPYGQKTVAYHYYNHYGKKPEGDIEEAVARLRELRKEEEELIAFIVRRGAEIQERIRKALTISLASPDGATLRGRVAPSACTLS